MSDRALTHIGSGKDALWLLVRMIDEADDARRNPVSTGPAHFPGLRQDRPAWAVVRQRPR